MGDRAQATAPLPTHHVGPVDPEWRAFPARVVTLWRVGAVVRPALFALVVVAVLVGPARSVVGDHLLNALVLTLAACGLKLLVGVALAPVRYSRCRWRVTSSTVDNEGGLLWRRSERLPRSRIQTMTISSGPISRRFGLCAVHLSTAGNNAELALSSLSQAEAEALAVELGFA